MTAAFFPLYGYMLILTNNWMYVNVTRQSRKLAWLFVTPRSANGNERSVLG